MHPQEGCWCFVGSGHFGILGRKFISTSGVRVTSVPGGPSPVLPREGKGRWDWRAGEGEGGLGEGWLETGVGRHCLCPK